MRKLIVFLLLLTAPAAYSAPAKTEMTFVRLSRDSHKKPRSLDTSITHFVSDEGWSVDLVAAVHLGELGYYQALNKEFTNYQAVLYELIAEDTPGHRPAPVPGDTSGPLSSVQTALCRLLGLQFQLDCVDYRPRNFVHADVSPEEFGKSMERRNESFSQMLVRLMQSGGTTSPASEKELNKLDMVKIMMHGPTPHDRYILRLVLADTFSDLKQFDKVFGSETGGSTMIQVRNDKVMEVLTRHLKAGRKNFAIYYGAAHMPDMSAKLIRDFHAHPTGQRWLPAWDLRAPAAN